MPPTRGIKDAAELEHKSVQDTGASPSLALAKQAEHRLLLEALRRIPIDYQIALELYYFEDMSGPEIATVLEVP